MALTAGLSWPKTRLLTRLHEGTAFSARKVGLLRKPSFFTQPIQLFSRQIARWSGSRSAIRKIWPLWCPGFGLKRFPSASRRTQWSRYSFVSIRRALGSRPRGAVESSQPTFSAAASSYSLLASRRHQTACPRRSHRPPHWSSAIFALPLAQTAISSSCAWRPRTLRTCDTSFLSCVCFNSLSSSAIPSSNSCCRNAAVAMLATAASAWDRSLLELNPKSTTAATTASTTVATTATCDYDCD